MRCIPWVSSVLTTGLLLAALPSAAEGQTDGPPKISQRQFTGGSAKLTMTGSAKIDEEIAINDKASYGDGTMTWLQYGVSGAEQPNVLITYGESGEIGISIGKGKFVVTGSIMAGEESNCSGKAQATATLVSGEYTCTGVASYEPGKGMGKVDIKVRFTAKS
jgi:hypothetical protein